MKTLKLLLSKIKRPTKGEIFGLIAMMSFVLFMRDVTFSATLLIMHFMAGVVIVMTCDLIDVLYPAVPKINVPELANNETYVIIKKSTGIIVDAYKGDALKPNLQTLKQEMDESENGSFLDVYSVVLVVNMRDEKMSQIVGKHAGEAFKESLNRQGFNKTWKGLEA
jgi:hypothetical protein